MSMPVLSDEEGTSGNPFSGAGDLFDAELDDDSDEGRRTPPASPKLTSPFSDEEDIPLAKGKSKGSRNKYAKKKEGGAPRPRKQRASKKSAEMEIAAIHMESQRMLRESSIVIPKYENKVKSLDAFLVKLKKPLAQDNTKTKPPMKPVKVVKLGAMPATDSHINGLTKLDQTSLPKVGCLKKPQTLVPSLSGPEESLKTSSLGSAQKSKFIDLTALERKRTVGQTTPGSTTSNGQVQQLMERFLRHSSQPAAEKSLVSFGSVETKAEFSLQSLSSTPSGLQRNMLQDQLRHKMQEQRALERWKANEQRQIEEEAGFSDEEEAEFTDESDDSQSAEENSDKEDKQDEEEAEGEDEAEVCALEDKHASDVESDSDGSGDSSEEESGSDEDDEREDGDAGGSSSDDSDEDNLLPSISHRRRTSDERQLLLSDDEQLEDGLEVDKLDMLSDGAEVRYSLDDSQSGFPSAQPRCPMTFVAQKTRHISGSVDSSSQPSATDTHSVLSSAGKMSLSQRSSPSLSSLAMPVEDSQDLYSLRESKSPESGLQALIQAPLKNKARLLSNATSESSQASTSNLLSPEASTASGGSPAGDTQEFSMSRSPNLIRNLIGRGLQNTGSMCSEGTISLFSDSQPASTMNELLQVCSGTFATQPNATQDSQLTEASVTGSQSQALPSSCMSELLGLCSGQFNTQPSEPYRPSPSSSFNAAALDECANMEMPMINGGNERQESSDEEAMPILRSVRKAQADTGGSSIHKNLAAYVEDEAELSGSDVGPDDDDLGSSGDDYEVEENSEEENLPKGAALAKQVNRVHQKVSLAADDAELRTYKELILGDADYEDGMNLDGFFRTRRYRPALDEGSQLDLFSSRGSDDSSDEENDDQREAQRRRERHKRTTFLYNQRLKQSDDSLLLQDEDSQSIFTCMKENSQSGFSKPKTKRPQGQVKCGSFLSRSKATLTRLQTQTSAALNLNGSTRSFVFQKRPAAPVDTTNTNKSTELSAKPVMRRSTSLPQGLAAKRPRLDRQNSVFQKM